MNLSLTVSLEYFTETVGQCSSSSRVSSHKEDTETGPVPLRGSEVGRCRATFGLSRPHRSQTESRCTGFKSDDETPGFHRPSPFLVGDRGRGEGGGLIRRTVLCFSLGCGPNS